MPHNKKYVIIRYQNIYGGTFMIRQKKAVFLTALIIFILFTCFGCNAAMHSGPLSKTGFYFNTVITITIYGSTDESLLEDCFRIADKYEKLFSATLPESEISQINQAKGAPVTVSDETVSLLKKGLSYCELSQGGFDITIVCLTSPLSAA